MNGNQELLAHISAELHDVAKCRDYEYRRVPETPEPTIYGRPIRTYLGEIADRIDAACVGNAAKLREAVVKCVNLISEFGNAEIVETPLDVIVDIEAILKAALAAPARNCEKYETAKDAEAAFDNFCMKTKHGVCKPYSCSLPQKTGAGSGLLAWLFANDKIEVES